MSSKPKGTLPEDRILAHRALYERKSLGAYETISGQGSTLMATRHLRKSLEAFLASGAVKTLIDIGCGDANWVSMLNLSGVEYLGVDLIPELIEQNRARYPAMRFELFDITQNVPAQFDMALCRDVFSHFCQPEIIRTLNNLKHSGARYLAASRYQPDEMSKKMQKIADGQFNANMPPGYWRPSNLLMPPFLFPPPLLSLPENQAGKFLDIYRLEDIPFLPPAPELRARIHDPITPDDFRRYDFFNRLCSLPFVVEICLFGSRAKGTSHAGSDIDMYVCCDDGATREDWLKVCDIVERADIPLRIDCMRYGEEFITSVSRVEWPLIDKVLYARAH